MSRPPRGVHEATIVTRITIAASPAAVFKYLADLKYHHLWNPQLQQLSSYEKLRLHSRYQASSRVLGIKIEMTNSVTRFAPAREMQIENETGAVHYCANFQLRAQGDKTLVTCTTAVSSHAEAFAFAAPVLKALARRELQADLQALKLAVENNLSD